MIDGSLQHRIHATERAFSSHWYDDIGNHTSAFNQQVPVDINRTAGRKLHRVIARQFILTGAHFAKGTGAWEMSNNGRPTVLLHQVREPFAGVDTVRTDQDGDPTPVKFWARIQSADKGAELECAGDIVVIRPSSKFELFPVEVTGKGRSQTTAAAVDAHINNQPGDIVFNQLLH